MGDRKHVIAVVLAGAGAAGCSEGTTEPTTTAEPLSAAESMALFDGMRALQGDSTSVIGGSENSIVFSCPLGGQVSVGGTSVDEAIGDTLRLVSEFTATPAGCEFSIDGLQFAVDGAPDVRERTVLVIAGFLEHFSLEGTVAGRLDWRLDDRSGSCDIDLVLRGEPDLSSMEPSVTGTLSGTLCDHEVEIDAQDIPGPSG